MVPIVCGWSVHGPILGLALFLEQPVRLMGWPLTITAESECGMAPRIAVMLPVDANGPDDDPHR